MFRPPNLFVALFKGARGSSKAQCASFVRFSSMFPFKRVLIVTKRSGYAFEKSCFPDDDEATLAEKVYLVSYLSVTLDNIKR